jgi:hypothetical protein
MEEKITFTVVGYKYNYEWELFINCLLLQTDPRWKCQLINDGPDPIAKKVCSRYVDEFPDKFEYSFTNQRINDWGHSLRDVGLKQADTMYWSTQNADNYLMPTFVEYNLEAFKTRECDMTIFPCVHNYTNINPPKKSPPYCVLDVAPKANRCDAGSMVIKTELAQSVGWNHRFNQADGAFIEDIMKLNPMPRVYKLPNILMVHN